MSLISAELLLLSRSFPALGYICSSPAAGAPLCEGSSRRRGGVSRPHGAPAASPVVGLAFVLEPEGNSMCRKMLCPGT